jgi:hypothetical protein
MEARPATKSLHMASLRAVHARCPRQESNLRTRFRNHRLPRCLPGVTRVSGCLPRRADSLEQGVSRSPAARPGATATGLPGLGGGVLEDAVHRFGGLGLHRRGQLFSKLTRAIIVAAKEGGPDPSSNLALQNAIVKARAASMPKSNIDRAIARGGGLTLQSTEYEYIAYEATARKAWRYTSRLLLTAGIARLLRCVSRLPETVANWER